MNGPARGQRTPLSGGSLTGATEILASLALVKVLLHLLTAGNYGYFGPAHGIPNAISSHNSYFIWGPGDCTGEAVVSIGVPRNLLKEEFGKIE